MIEAGQDFQEKVEGYTFTYPGARIVVYREVDLPEPFEHHAYERVSEHTFRAPQEAKSEAGFRQWVNEKIESVAGAVASLGNNGGQVELFPADLLQPGIYQYEGRPSTHAYLVASPCLRDGDIRTELLDLAQGRVTGSSSISAQALTPFTGILSLLQKKAFSEHVPADNSRRTLDCFRGCLLGGAVGDAIGACVEKMSLKQVRACFGPAGIRDYTPNYGRLGAVTWHTQMALFTGKGLLRADVRGKHKGICHPPSVVRHAYLRWLLTQGEMPPEETASYIRDG